MAAAELDDEDGITGINVTPMVDIILVLLVIFMVTTTTINQIEGMQVDKPDAKTGQAVDEQNKSILIVCHEDGRVLVDGEDTPSDADVIAKIKAKKAENPELQGILQCDAAASVEALVHHLDLLREHGVTKYAIATEPPKEGADKAKN